MYDKINNYNTNMVHYNDIIDTNSNNKQTQSNKKSILLHFLILILFDRLLHLFHNTLSMKNIVT